jgi:hypothetical protein
LSQVQIQSIELLAVSLLFSSAILYLSRRGKISFRYTVGWLTLFGFMAIGSFAVPKIETVTDFLRISPAALVAVIILLLLLILCIQLSISISGLQRQFRKVNEDVALQKKAIDDLRDPQ